MTWRSRDRIQSLAVVVLLVYQLIWGTKLGNILESETVASATTRIMTIMEAEAEANVRNDTDDIQELINLVTLTGESRGLSQNPLDDTYDFCHQHFPNSTASYIATDRILPKSITHANGRRIPRILHMTSKSRCLTKPFHDNVQNWKSVLSNYSFFFHDDVSKQRLFSSEQYNDKHTELPNLFWITRCMKNQGAELADLWRYVLMYTYGGMYVDIDDAPGPLLQSLVQQQELPNDDQEGVFFQLPNGGLSQNLFWIAPKHPLMYFAVLEVYHSLLELEDVGAQYIPDVTGPSALGRAWTKYLGGQRKPKQKRTYKGIGGWTMAILATKEESHLYMNVSALDPYKADYYEAIQAQDYERHKGKSHQEANGKSCFQVLYESTKADSLESTKRKKRGK